MRQDPCDCSRREEEQVQAADIVMKAVTRIAGEGGTALAQVQACPDVPRHVMSPSRVTDIMGELERYCGDYETDVLELGERVADCLFAEELTAAYVLLQHRAWSTVLHCYGFIAVAAGDAGREVPACWQPAFDEHGAWRMPR